LPAAADVDTAAGPPTVVYAVRHAEKGSGDDPGLTAEGLARADALVGLLHDVPLVAVYATDLVRTQQTVAPTAADHGLPIVIDYDPEEELAAHILAENVGQSVLHAGHSYTLDDFMEALGLADPPSTSDYGDLWILTVAADGNVTLQTTCFGG
jgi:phosphohistidine phosphatase SixA